MRVLADMLVVALSLGAACLFGLLHTLETVSSADISPAALLASYIRSFLTVLPLLSVGVCASLALAGVYHSKPRLSRQGRLAAVGIGVTVCYGLWLTLALTWQRQTFDGALGSVFLSYGLTLGGCVGTRVLKAYVWQRFHVEPKAPRAGKPVRRVLLIGGAGYIGSVLARRLLRAHYEVRVLDKLVFGAEPVRDLYQNGRFELIQGDFRDVNAVMSAVRGVDAVVHLGAIVGDPACAIDEDATVETNYAATALVAEVCKGSAVSRLVFASTCSVYGAREYLVDEESLLNPVSLYAATKIDAEKILLSARGRNFRPTILRLGTAFGWSYRPRFDLVVNLLTAKAFCENKVVLFNEEQWRPFVHVRDIARAFQMVLEAPAEQVGGEVFNVGSQKLNHRLADVGKVLQGVTPGVMVVRESNTDVRNYRVSFEKIRQTLGFDCEVSLEQGILEIQRELAAGKVSDFTAPCYHNAKSAALAAGSDGRRSSPSLGLISYRFAERIGAQRMPVSA